MVLEKCQEMIMLKKINYVSMRMVKKKKKDYRKI